ncbi:unnamed protein product [Closterium sp. NIES-53]
MEGSRGQERGAPDGGARDAQAPRPHGKGRAEWSRMPERDQHHGEWRVGKFRPHVRRQDQEGGSGGGTRSPGRRQARKDEWRDEPRSPRPHGRQEGRHGAERVSRERRGQQQGERSSTMRSPGRPSQRAQQDNGGSRSPDLHRRWREEYGGEGHSPERCQQRSRREDAWSPSPERQPLHETSRGEGQKAREPPMPQWGRAEEWGGLREGRHESGGSRQEGRTEGGTLAHGAERAREAREGMQRARFDTWLDDLQLYLLSDSKDRVLLFDLVPGAATAPTATADSATHSQTTQALYTAVIARYSSPATAALGRLLLPYLFPELSAFATVEGLVSQPHTSDARYRAIVPAEFLERNQPPMFITLYFIVTRLPDSLRSVKDHFLSLDPTSLTVDLLEQHLLAAETSAVAVGAARGTPCPPFFEGCSPSPLTPSYASAAAADVPGAEDVGATSASAKRRSGKGKGSKSGGGGSGSGGGGSGLSR